MKKQNTFIVALAVVAAVCAAFWLLLVAPGYSGNAINMTRGVTLQSHMNYQLHMIVLWICAAIGVLVFSAMFISIVLHRKSKGHEAAKFSHNNTAEIIWSIVPVLILVAIAIPATRALIVMEVSPATEMTIKITGFQWRWKYEYLEHDIQFISSLAAESAAARQRNSGVDPAAVENYLLEVDRRLILPVNTKIKFLITADDVIHSWWVPALGWKRDAVPGFINEAWAEIEQPGIYRGQCAELCGKDHGFMPIVLEVLPQEEFKQWVDGQKRAAGEAATGIQRTWSREELMVLGESVYTRQCATCHQVDGSGLPPAFPPLAGSAVATGPLDKHIDVVLNGRAGTAMPAWGNMLTTAETAAVLTYTRNAFGNAGNDVVQPQTIAQVESGQTHGNQ